MPLSNPNVLIVGGGLSGSLLAWRLVGRRPELDVSVLESGPTIGGSHTWSFHETDIPAAERRWLSPLIAARWPSHEVKFPGISRMLSGAYASITADRLREVIATVLGARLRTGVNVAVVEPTTVTLDTGERISARVVIDARGGSAAPPSGWQTFVGQDLELESDHDQQRPLLMDATVAQDGGYRFIYVLPWSARQVLVEDTLYGSIASIDVEDRRRRIADYAQARGWKVHRVIREEQGALPIPFSGTAASFWPDRTIRIGMRAGLFHPTTGYSLPDAVATAALLSDMPLDSHEQVYDAIRDFAERRWSDRAFFRMLNRLLFLAAEPQRRVDVLEQFYRRDERLIARFYAGRLSWLDQCRLLSGRPPVPLMKALHQLRPEMR